MALQGGRDRDLLLGALVALRHYSMDLTEVARHTLGRGSAANREIGVLLTINAKPGITPSALAQVSGIDRAVGSRTLRGLENHGVIRRDRDPDDGRIVHLVLTGRGRRRIVDFEHALADFFRAQSPFVAGIVEALDAAHRPLDRDRPDGTLAVAERLAAAGSAFTEAATTATSGIGMTAMGRYALAEVALAGSVRPYELATRLRITTGGVTHILNRLEREGLVERSHPHADVDGRAVRVTVTAKGRRITRAMTRVLATHAADISSALGATLLQGSAPVRTSAPANT